MPNEPQSHPAHPAIGVKETTPPQVTRATAAPLSQSAGTDQRTERAQSTEGKERRMSAIQGPVTRRGEATRRRILDSAEDVFGESGYYEASVSEITRRAAVAQGTFYIYFHTKRDIFVELVDDLGRQLRDAMRRAIGDAPTRLDAERRGFAAFFTFVADHHRIYSIVQEAERVAPEAAQAYYRNISRGYERGLRAAIDAGEVRSLDPEVVAHALMGIGHMLALRWIIWPQHLPADDQSPGDHPREGQRDGRRDGQREVAPTGDANLPPEVFEAALDFIAHGLLPDGHSGTPSQERS